MKANRTQGAMKPFVSTPKFNKFEKNNMINIIDLIDRSDKFLEPVTNDVFFFNKKIF